MKAMGTEENYDMKLLNKLLTASCLMAGYVLSAIYGLAQTLPPYHAPLPPQAVVGSTAERQAAYNSLTDDQRRAINDRVRPYMQNAIIQALVNRQTSLGNQDLAVHAPTIDGLMKHDLTRALSLQSPLTVINGSGATSSVPLYPATTSAFPANPVSGQIAGNDFDHDGLPDNFENQLADEFTPFYHVSAGEPDNFATFFNAVPETVNQRLGPNPFSYFRVKPLGFATSTTGIEYGVIQINYLTLWDHDSGLDVGATCNTLMALAGRVIGVSLINLVSVLTSHDLDDEHSAALVLAPTVNGGFNLDPTQYSAISYFLAAHEGTFFDHSVFLNPATLVPANVHQQYGLSRKKHSTYNFNPDGQPMFPDELIFAYFAELSDLFAAGVITPTEYAYLLFVGDTVFFGCVIEHFSEQGGTFASGRVNVGEPVAGSTINGAGFILDPKHALPKLTETLWTVGTPPIIVTVTPAATGMNSGEVKQFTAAVLNAPNNNQGVTWSIDPSLGSITQAGVYTAPTVTSQQTVTVSACSTSNAARCGTALVFLNPLAGACLSPASLTFGDQVTGTTSAAQTVTLTSCGAEDLIISSITTSGNFDQTNNCTSPLVPNASCTINITFTPSTTGVFTGTLAVSDSAHNSPHTVSLTGSGVGPPDFALSIDGPQTIDPTVTYPWTTINYGVTFLNSQNQTVSLSLSADICLTGTVAPLSQSVFSSSGSGTFSFWAVQEGTMCFYLTGSNGFVTKTVSTTVTVTYPPPPPPSGS